MKRSDLVCACIPNVICSACLEWERHQKVLARKRKWRKKNNAIVRAKERERYAHMKVLNFARYVRMMKARTEWQRNNRERCRVYVRNSRMRHHGL